MEHDDYGDETTPADLERAAENEAQDAHYGPDGPPLPDEVLEAVAETMRRAKAEQDPLADCPHPADGFVTVGAGARARRACGACWRDFGPVTSDELPAPTTPPLPTADELLHALEQIGGVLRDHAPVLVVALTDELKRERWQHEQTRLQLQGRETRLDVERREHAAERRAWALERAALVDDRTQLEADALELLGIVGDEHEPVTSRVREHLAAQIEAERYQQPGEVPIRTGTVRLAGGDPDDHALSTS